MDFQHELLVFNGILHLLITSNTYKRFEEHVGIYTENLFPLHKDFLIYSC
jgi:hypothetical protein